MSLNREQTLHWIENMRRSHWWQSQMPVALSALDEVLGGGTKLKYATKSTKGYKTLEKIGKLIPDIEARRLCFPPLVIGLAGPNRPPKFIWVEPEPVTIPRLGKAWSLWAYCQTCQGNKFLPVMIDNKEHYACFHCLHPTQYKAIGATEVKRSLIHEALKQYY